MEAKHTPGPWHSSSNDRANGLVIYAKDGWAVADARVFHARHTLDEARANVRLIAAAPELLEALQAVVRVADRATVEFDMARAAIAKATQ